MFQFDKNVHKPLQRFKEWRHMYVHTRWEQYAEASDNGTVSQLYTSSFEGHLGYFTGKEYSFYLRNIVGSLDVCLSAHFSF